MGQAEPKGRLLGKGLYSDPTRPVNILVQIETTVTSGQWLSILADEAQGHTYRHLLVPPRLTEVLWRHSSFTSVYHDYPHSQNRLK